MITKVKHEVGSELTRAHEIVDQLLNRPGTAKVEILCGQPDNDRIYSEMPVPYVVIPYTWQIVRRKERSIDV